MLCIRERGREGRVCVCVCVGVCVCVCVCVYVYAYVYVCVRVRLQAGNTFFFLSFLCAVLHCWVKLADGCCGGLSAWGSGAPTGGPAHHSAQALWVSTRPWVSEWVALVHTCTDTHTLHRHTLYTTQQIFL